MPPVVNTSRHTKWLSLSNLKCKIQPAVINLHSNEYCQALLSSHSKLDRWVGICNTLNDFSNKVYTTKKNNRRFN